MTHIVTLNAYIVLISLNSFKSCPDKANIVASYENWVFRPRKFKSLKIEALKSPENPGACFSTLTNISLNFLAVSGSPEQTDEIDGNIENINAAFVASVILEK